MANVSSELLMLILPRLCLVVSSKPFPIEHGEYIRKKSSDIHQFSINLPFPPSSFILSQHQDAFFHSSQRLSLLSYAFISFCSKTWFSRRFWFVILFIWPNKYLQSHRRGSLEEAGIVLSQLQPVPHLSDHSGLLAHLYLGSMDFIFEISDTKVRRYRQIQLQSEFRQFSVRAPDRTSVSHESQR